MIEDLLPGMKAPVAMVCVAEKGMVDVKLTVSTEPGSSTVIHGALRNHHKHARGHFAPNTSVPPAPRVHVSVPVPVLSTGASS